MLLSRAWRQKAALAMLACAATHLQFFECQMFGSSELNPQASYAQGGPTYGSTVPTFPLNSVAYNPNPFRTSFHPSFSGALGTSMTVHQLPTFMDVLASVKGCVTPSREIHPTRREANACAFVFDISTLTSQKFRRLKWGRVDVGCTPGSSTFQVMMMTKPQYSMNPLKTFYSILRRVYSSMDTMTQVMAMAPRCECYSGKFQPFFASIHSRTKYIIGVGIQVPPRRKYWFYPEKTNCALPTSLSSIYSGGKQPGSDLEHLGNCLFRFTVPPGPYQVIGQYNSFTVIMADGTDLAYTNQLPRECTMANPKTDLRVWSVRQKTSGAWNNDVLYIFAEPATGHEKYVSFYKIENSSELPVAQAQNLQRWEPE